jgi:2-dehydro-3-deoxyphosphogluconate aldolase / (4S)-4-hydroxy-2-oxoglutarate aldolase
MSTNPQKGLEAALRKAPVVPVMVIEDVKQAVPLARALVKGGLPVLEITLRTEAAMECIKAIIAEVEGAIVGAGTILTPQQLRDCEKIGCQFAVSPGSTGKLLGEAEDRGIALLPGGVTASECMALLEWGYTIQKFFPAEPAGGTAYLSSLASPFPQVKFCPTGGITPQSAPISSCPMSSRSAAHGWHRRNSWLKGTGQRLSDWRKRRPNFPRSIKRYGFSHRPLFSERKNASMIFMFWMASSTPQTSFSWLRITRPKASAWRWY